MANAARLALAVMAHNLGRAVGQLAGAELDTAAVAGRRHQQPDVGAGVREPQRQR